MFERIKEMDRRTLIPLLLAGVIGILLFSTVVGGIRQAGWNEGFMVGLLAGGGEQAKALAPALTHGDLWSGNFLCADRIIFGCRIVFGYVWGIWRCLWRDDSFWNCFFGNGDPDIFLYSR